MGYTLSGTPGRNRGRLTDDTRPQLDTREVELIPTGEQLLTRAKEVARPIEERVARALDGYPPPPHPASGDQSGQDLTSPVAGPVVAARHGLARQGRLLDEERFVPAGPLKGVRPHSPVRPHRRKGSAHAPALAPTQREGRPPRPRHQRAGGGPQGPRRPPRHRGPARGFGPPARTGRQDPGPGDGRVRGFNGRAGLMPGVPGEGHSLRWLGGRVVGRWRDP